MCLGGARRPPSPSSTPSPPMSLAAQRRLIIQLKPTPAGRCAWPLSAFYAVGVDSREAVRATVVLALPCRFY